MYRDKWEKRNAVKHPLATEMSSGAKLWLALLISWLQVLWLVAVLDYHTAFHSNARIVINQKLPTKAIWIVSLLQNTLLLFDVITWEPVAGGLNGGFAIYVGAEK